MLNITNGDYFNEYFKNKFNARAVPFREVMMQGVASEKIFSSEFISNRAISLGVEEREYLKNCADLLSAVDELKGGGQIDLWFGKDTFCQLNALTALAYLEQIGYGGKVFFNFIDDESFEIISEKTEVKLGVYNQIYIDVILNKRPPKTYGVLDKEGVDLYFDYLSNNGFLANEIKLMAKKSKEEIVERLIKISSKYGLSDLLAVDLIKRILG
ncbi:MAG: hypothetical protein IJY84_03865 [Clostridia bacterium]|nr:hypothetical protein [Clostridia bacterium]